MVKVGISSARLKKLAERLNFENQQNGRSWRDIAEEYPPIVKAGTLCSLAKNYGYCPQDREILIALGLIDPPAPKAEDPPWVKPIKRNIARMARETKRAVLEHEYSEE